jgi:tetraacyldisaccharide 4'-kinase
MQWLIKSWYAPHPLRWLLLPLSSLYRLVVSLRKQCYSLGLFKQHSLAVPVIIVGNITVGGTGKTPFVIWLTQQLQQQGFKPGIISRGYGGHAKQYPLSVTSDSNANTVGDEPLIIARQTACPVVISPNRVEAGQWLLEHHQCDVVISDDGLQHYALARAIEITIVDSERLFGNKLCLPAGPLREPLSRLNSIDFTVYNGSAVTNTSFQMTLTMQKAINLRNHHTKPLTEFINTEVHGVAGIGHPQRFFNQLSAQGITVIPHAFIDHHHFQSTDLNFDDDKAILMTEKDAVKCHDFSTEKMWYIPVTASVTNNIEQLIFQKLTGTPSHG